MPATKRKALTKQEGKKQQKHDGQKAISHDIDVPVDEGFNVDGKLLSAITIIDWRPPAPAYIRYMLLTDTTDPRYSGCQSLYRRRWNHIRCLPESDQHWRQQQQGRLRADEGLLASVLIVK